MGLFEQFPYTNFHELNLDWILQQLKEFQERLDQFHDTIVAECNAYTDSQLAGIRADFAQMEADFISFKADINQQFADYTAKTDKMFVTFEDLINARITLLQQEIRDAKAELQTLLNQSIAYTDNKFAQVTILLPDIVTQQIKNGYVYNLLEGEYITIQQMFDYLSLFHAPSALTCAMVYGRNNTNAEIVEYNRTCTDFTIEAKNFIIDRG